MNSTIKPGVVARHSRGVDGDTALVFIIDVDPSADVCDIALAHYEPTLATERDIVVSGDETSLGYDIVIQTDVRASTRTEQISLALATTPPDVVKMARNPDLLVASARRGLRLKGRLDSRWDFKVSEVRRLHRLVNIFKEEN